MLVANPETLDTFKSHYRPKVALLILVYLISPRDPTHLPNVNVHTDAIAAAPSVASVQSGVGSLVGATIGLASTPGESPFTPAFQLGGKHHKRTRQSVEQGGAQNTGAKGSTTGIASTWFIPTPPLSPPPPPKRSVNPLTDTESSTSKNSEGAMEGEELDDDTRPPESESTPCPIDFRGRCTDETRVSTSLRTRSSELADATNEIGLWVIASLLTLAATLLHSVQTSPLILAFALMHGLFAIELASLVVEDAIIRLGLSNPLPPDFARAGTLSKRLARWRWRLKATGERYWTHGVLVVGLAVLVGIVGRECWMGERAAKGGWDDVPFGRWILQAAQGDVAVLRGWGKIAPLRVIIGLETLTALIYLIQPVKHLLVPSILPATLVPPSFLLPAAPAPITNSSSFFPRPSSRPRPGPPDSIPSLTLIAPLKISLDTLWLLTLLTDVLSSILTTLQFLLLIPLITSFSPLTLSPHIIFHSFRGRFIVLRRLRRSLIRTVGCLETIFNVFPEEGGNQEEEEGEWACAICFEGVEEDSGDATGEKTARARCRLPCGHKYHAGCLVHWCHFQSFCPQCHHSLAPSSPTHIAPFATPRAPRTAPHVNVFPGDLARRAERAAARGVP